MYVFGGYDGARCSTTSSASTSPPPSGAGARGRHAAVPRGGHTAVVHGDALYAFGGKSGRSPFSDSRSTRAGRVGARRRRRAAAARRCARLRRWAQSPSSSAATTAAATDDCFEYCFQPPESQSVLSPPGPESMVNRRSSPTLPSSSTADVHAPFIRRAVSTSAACSPPGTEAEAAQIPIQGVCTTSPLRPLVFVHGEGGELSPEVALTCSAPPTSTTSSR